MSIKDVIRSQKYISNKINILLNEDFCFLDDAMAIIFRIIINSFENVQNDLSIIF